MFHQVECKNLMEAHMMRSRLLEEDIESWVVNENASALYVESAMPPRLLVRDEDWDRTQEVINEVPQPLGDDFVPPTDEKPEKPELPFKPEFIEILATITLLTCIAGLAFLSLEMMFGIAEESIQLSDHGSSQWISQFRGAPATVLTGGALLAVGAWAGIMLARKCRRRADGTLPIGARWILFVLLLFATDFAFLVLGPIQIIRDILHTLNSAAF